MVAGNGRIPRRVLLPDEQTRLLLDAYGAQSITVARARGGGPQDNPYILVRSPNTLTYCFDAEAVTAHTYAWLLAHAHAPALRLPGEAAAPTAADSVRLIASHTVHGTPPVTVHPVPALRSPTGRAHLAVRIGHVTVRCHDRTGLQSHIEAWLDAYAAAELTFPTGPQRSIGELHRHAVRDARSPYACLRNLDRIRDLGEPTRAAAR